MKEKPDIKVIILGAGFGTRLKGAIGDTPKGLIKRNDTTLFGYLLNEVDELIAEKFISKACLITNDRYYEHFKVFINKNHKQSFINILNDGVDKPKDKLGAIGDLIFTLNEMDWWNSDILILPTDTYYVFSLQNLIKFFQKNRGVVVAIRKYKRKSQIANKIGCVLVENKRIIDFVEKPSTPKSMLGANPFYIYPKESLALISKYKDEGNDLEAPGSLLPWIIEKGEKVFAFDIDGTTLDVGRPEDIKKLEILDY